MARPPRLEVPGALYHVIARGNQRRPVFRSRADYETYLARLTRYQDRYGFLLYAYVLMPNHVHLLLEPAQTPLSKIMQGLQQSYVAYFNRTHRTVGHVFQGRYKAILCDRDRYLLALVRYLHANPVRSRLTRGAREWRWSSHRAYLGDDQKPRVATERVLLQFHPRRDMAIRRYLEFLKEPGAAEHRAEFYRTAEQRVLGDERFVAQVVPQGWRETVPSRVDRSFGEVCRLVAGAFDLSAVELRAPGRGRRAALARAVAAHVAAVVCGTRLIEAARAFGRDQATITLTIQHLRARLARDPHLAERVEQLMAALRRSRSREYKIINV